MFDKEFNTLKVGIRIKATAQKTRICPYLLLPVIREAFIYINIIKKEIKHIENPNIGIRYEYTIEGNLVIDHIGKYSREEMESIYKEAEDMYKKDSEGCATLIELFGLKRVGKGRGK